MVDDTNKIDLVQEALKEISLAWDELGLEDYRIIVQIRGRRKLYLQCPENDGHDFEIPYTNKRNHENTPQWRGLSQAYWLANNILQMLSSRKQREAIRRASVWNSVSNRIVFIDQHGAKIGQPKWIYEW